MKRTQAIAMLVLVAAVSISSCGQSVDTSANAASGTSGDLSTSASGGRSADDRATEYLSRFPSAVVPRAESLDKFLVDLMPWGPTGTASRATLALYADPAKAPGMARVCIGPIGESLCVPPDQETGKEVGVVDGYSIILFSGPNDVGLKSRLADLVLGTRWAVQRSS